MKRRDFLRQLLLYTGGLSFGLPSYALQDASKRHFLVHFHIGGGAHSILGPGFVMDSYFKGRSLMPLEEVDYYKILRDEEAVPLGDSFVGPALRPLMPYFDRTLVIDGIMMKNNSVSHWENANYIRTGNRSSSGELLSRHINKSSDEIFGLLSNRSMNEFTMKEIMQVGNGSLTEGLKKPLGYDLYSSGERTRFKRQSLEQFNNFERLMSADAVLEKHPVLRSRTGGLANIATGYLAGFSQSAYYETQSFGTVDTHSFHENSAIPAQTQHYREVASFIELIKEIDMGDSTSLYDQTTIIVTTDFSRSAWKEGNDGTAHNPWTNSVVIISPKVNGNQKIGRSDIMPAVNVKDGLSKFFALPYDFRNQRSLSFSEFLQFSGGQEVDMGDLEPMTRDFNSEVALITPEVVINTLGMALNKNYQSRFFNKNFLTKAIS